MNEKELAQVKEILKEPEYQRAFCRLIKEFLMNFPEEMRGSLLRNILLNARAKLEGIWKIQKQGKEFI